MADWQTISALATAGGTLVLAGATFSAVRSSNRSARIAEQALLANLRPLLINSQADDRTFKVLWSDGHAVRVEGGRASAEQIGDVIYLAMSVRNVGAGIALLHGWYAFPQRTPATEPHRPLDEFRRLTIDLYIAAGTAGYWEGAIREPDDPFRLGVSAAVIRRHPFTVDLLYGDQDGGQRTVSRFAVLPAGEDAWICQASRHWNIDRPDPR